MREDMAKVIVERPRIKPWSTRKGRRVDPEDLPKHEGMRRGHALRGATKELNENLAPLRRYLAKQVGRPWNKVYSEISAHLQADNTVQQHVRDHLHDFVAIKPRRNIAGWRTSLRDGLWWQPFYVHPLTGLLCRTDRLPEEKARRRAKKDRKPPPAERIVIGIDCELRRIDGIWYEVRLAPLPEPAYQPALERVMVPIFRRGRKAEAYETEIVVRRLISSPVWDVAERRLMQVGPSIDAPNAWKAYRRKQPDRRYAVAKRTLSSRELRQHKLTNAPEAPE